MKKFYSLILALIFIVFSCKGTPKDDKGAGNPGLSQLELTSEEDEAGPGFDDEPQSDESSAGEDALAQGGITDGSVAAENQAEEKPEEKPVVVEAKDEVKETPKPEEKKPTAEEKQPAAQAAKPAQPPLSVIKEDPSASQAKADDKSADDKKDAQSESAAPPPRYQPWITPPPAVTAVKDDAPIPNQRGLTAPPKEEEIVFSRIVRAMVGQYVEIPFRGNNWSYLENTAYRRGIVYDSRRNDSEGVIFIFKAEEAGTYTLKFYRRDYIRDYILNDYVQVIVSESPDKNGNAGWFNPPADRVRVTAEPRWPSALDESAVLRGGAKPASQLSPSQAAPQTAPQATPQTAPAASMPPQVVVITPGTGAPSQSPQTGTPQAAPQTPPVTDTPDVKQEILPPEEILKRAQDAFNGGKAAEAIALLDQYMEFYPGGDDELYWLYGQFYEANTPSRNILLSLDYYRRLVNEYPQSRRYNDAKRRISYLERFYVNIQ